MSAEPILRLPETRYRIVRRIGAGGMAEVYLGEALGIAGWKKHVAIKRVLPHLVKKGDFVQMLIDEGRLGAHIEHPHCVSVLDLGRAYDAQFGHDRYFIVMEYVDGPSARELLRWLLDQGLVFSVGIAVLLIRDACLGLHYAHTLSDQAGRALEIVHRDISPGNLLISRHGTVKVADFGVAKAATKSVSSNSDIVKGKFSYLCPEVLQQVPLDGRADVFAAGAVLWELLTGHKLFEGETPAQTVALVERAQYRGLSTFRDDLDPSLDALIARAVVREREQRPTAAQLARALTEWLVEHHQPVSALELAALVQNYLARESVPTELADEDVESLDARDQCEHMTRIFEPTPGGRGSACS